MSLNLKKIHSIHFTGIKGVGMTALALCAQDLKKKISGSDTPETFPTCPILKKRGLRAKLGFSPKNLPRHCDLLIHTGAHGGATNPEAVAAKQRKIPVLNHAQGLALFTENKKTLAVAGVGGKSTTAGLIATVLDSAGLKPSFAIGVGNLSPLNVPGRFNRRSAYFVVESDEYVADPQTDLTPRFHYLRPFLAVVTNLEHDHPDVYPTFEDIFQSFKKFVSKVPASGAIIVNGDQPHLKRLITELGRPVISYGFSPQADWQIIKTHTASQKQFFSLKFKDMSWSEFVLNLPGRYNVLNATAATAAGHHLGISVKQIQLGLKSFKGCRRRFEFIGQVKDILLYDDYAHHPIEIQALLKAAQDWFPGRRIIVIFQSHTYSRTKTLLPQFAKSFSAAHQVIINDIFPSARETDNLGMTGLKLVQAIQPYQSQVHYCPDKTATLAILPQLCRQGDVIFTLGAGNNFLWHKDILKVLRSL
jgi:UDP-N-acetylmuramate--alanine ligase